MKKEDPQKPKGVNDVKNHHEQRSRSHSPKAYRGCGTCKSKNNELKKNRSVSKFSDNNCNVEKNKLKKVKKTSQELVDQEKEENTRSKVKITDLCDEDKTRIVELIEEISVFAEKNQKLKEMIDRMQKTRQEQQDYIMKQAKLHLEEKNFYANEINNYKRKIESLENDIKNKMFEWKKHEKLMNSEISYYANALQESVNEKNDLVEQMNHLKICLRQSVESFQLLRDDVKMLQNEENTNKNCKSASCQTEFKSVAFKETHKSDDDEANEDFFSISQQTSMDTRSSLDVINDKLEHVYQLLKKKSENLGRYSPRKFDIDLSVLLKKEKLADDVDSVKICRENEPKETEQGIREIGYKFLKPSDYYGKTSTHAERILKKMVTPLNFIINQKANCGPNNFEVKENFREDFVQQNIVQQNNLFVNNDSHQCEEDKLLEDLFYTDRNLKNSLEPALKENDKA